MKVLWLASWYPNKFSPDGGFIQRMAMAASSFCQVAVLHAVESEVATFEMEVTDGKVFEVIVYLPLTDGNIKLIKNAVRGLKFVWAYFIGFKTIRKKFGRPDLLHLQVIFPAGYFVLIYLFFTKLPLVVTEHWSMLGKRYRNKLRFYHMMLIRLCHRKAKIFSVVSKSLALDLQEAGLKGDYYITPNVVSIAFSSSLDKKPSRNLFTFLHVSSLVERKNVEGIIRAFRVLHDKLPNVHLRIVGDGSNRKNLEQLVNSLELSEKITFAGLVAYDGVAQEMNNAHAFVLFSNHETFSCVLLESLCARLPVVSSKCGGISEWITNDVGYLIEVEDEIALAEAMEKMIANYDNFRFDSILDKISMCSYDSLGKQFLSLYQKALGCD